VLTDMALTVIHVQVARAACEPGAVIEGLRVVEFDPLTDDDLLHGWVDAGLESAREEFGDRHTVYSLEEVRERSRTVSDRRFVMLAALLDGEVVAEANLHLPLKDNLHFAAVWMSVRPRWRRRGVGSALLAEVERQASLAGRTTVCVESDTAPGRPAAADAFAPTHGYEKALVSVRSDLDLPEAGLDDLLAPLESEAAPFAVDYDLLTWWDDVPDEWLDQRAALAARMSTDTPLGEIDVEEEAWDAERVRAQFAAGRAMGRRMVETVAVHGPTGRAVAFTDLAVAEHTPDVAYQWDTLVLADHRGHRLGQLVKAANLRALRAGLPGVRRVVTWNAESNRPMLRVNRALGFRPTGLNTEWQKHLG
jgi:GNAT superfamily N-acetyltransferase